MKDKSVCRTEFLTDDILLNILYRLPAKEVIRCTSVCKTWRFLIMEPDFFSNHLRHHEGKHVYAMYRWTYSSPPHTYIFHKSSTNTTYQLDNPNFPFGCESSHLAIVCSVNGLLLVTDSHSFGQTIYLWNPSIWKLKIIRDFGREGAYAVRRRLTTALGYHPRTNDYMVVWIKQRYIPMGLRVPRIYLPLEVELYSLANNSWRKVEVNSAYKMVWTSQLQKSPVFINGASHWIASMNGKDFIWKFHFESEEFGEIMLPKNEEEDHQDYPFQLSILRESLCLITICLDRYPVRYIKHCTIWVMMEYGVTESWTKLYVVVPEERCKTCLGIINHHELLLHTGENIISYDLQSKQFKRVENEDHKGDWEDWDGFTDNLVLYNEGTSLTPRRYLLTSENEEKEEVCF